jgi:predicted RNA binding protein YcfA (HicA-like mRNA interferase family)
MVMKVKEVISLLEEDGWKFKRMRGDHRIYWKQDARRPIVVPGNLNDELKDGTLRSIFREAGLKK